MTNFRKFNVSFGAMIFLTVVTVTIFTALLNKTLPSLASETFALCQQYLSGFPDFLVLGSGLILLLGILSFTIQLFRTNLLLKRLLIKKTGITGKLGKTIAHLNMGGKVILLRDNNLFSFCYGIFSSRIIITTALVSSLTGKELEAVLLHEKAHLNNLDSLKILLGKTISSMLFFLPIFSELHKNMIASNELLADKYVLDSQLGAQFLKSAIKKILITPQVNLSLVPAVADPDYLEIRIRRLTNPSLKVKLFISPLSIITSFLFVLFSLLLLQTPVQAFPSKHAVEQPSQECRQTQNSIEKNLNNPFKPDVNLEYNKIYSPQE